MTGVWTFPFGQQVHEVVQSDRTPKKVFILGVYSSAVHAQWVNPNGKSVVKALAVANEPYIFWGGENAQEIIRPITIPPALGRLLPANRQFNGPAGRALDELILKPLGLNRCHAWLCDLVPHSCVNPSQKAAIERDYAPIAKQYGLPDHTVPTVPKILADETRRREILAEIQESRADVLIVLGDQPIEWFLCYFDPRWRKLSDFGLEEKSYGKLHAVTMEGKPIKVLPLAHPRQIARLGQSSLDWHNRHKEWLNRDTARILGA
jgi:uracil-DNA glycosylase